MPESLTILQHEEHGLWQRVCHYLKEAGAVTEADLNSSLSARDTKGQQLLALLRTWGNYVVMLHLTDVRDKIDNLLAEKIDHFDD